MIGSKLKAALRHTSAILIAAAFIAACCLFPRMSARVSAESRNRSVVLSVLYPDLRGRVSDVDTWLDRFREAGVTAVTLPEDTVSSLASRGDAVSVRYRDVRWRFDGEWEEIGRLLENVDGIEYGSHVVLVRNEDVKARLDLWLPLYYSDSEYTSAGSVGDVSVYVFFDGNIEDYDIPVGYDESSLETVARHGLDAALSMRVGAHGNVGYIEKTEELIEKYGVGYFVLRRDSFSRDTDDDAEKNAALIAGAVRSHMLTLVLTETESQLSNEKCIGYGEIFDAAEGRVMRSFETYDCSNPDPTGYRFRYMQYLNSVTDRNIRFINVTQLSLGGKSNEQLAADTVSAVRTTREKLTSLGYDVGGAPAKFDYPSAGYVYPVAAAFAVLAGLSALAVVFGSEGALQTLVGIAAAALAAVLTPFMPRGILLLYPTAVALAVPCLASALMLAFVRRYRSKLGTYLLIPGAALSSVAVCCVGGVVMSALTSGLGYYVNNDIFRGIKLTLFAPLAFTAAAYYFMFVHKRGSLGDDLKKALGARVRVWWCAVAALFGGVFFIYILRSGNVDSISRAEETMRNFITEHFAARPRTKEFLAAYPCAVLFAWYAKNTHGKTAPWLLSVGAAILPASLTNTFCHVFTDVEIQYGRVAVGMLFGVLTSAAVLALNHCAVALYRRAAGKVRDDAPLE